MDIEAVRRRKTPSAANMAEPLRNNLPSPRLPYDEHYANPEHRSQRRRIDSPAPRPQQRSHYPGDGLDFRRPVMSYSGQNEGRDQQGDNATASVATQTIDLTDDAGNDWLQDVPLNLPRGPGEATASSSRANRLPRFDRNIIDIADSDGEDNAHNTQMPHTATGSEDEDSLFIPAPPTTAGLRRPGSIRPHSHAADVNDVQFVEARPLSRPASRTPIPDLTARRPTAHRSNTNNSNAMPRGRNDAATPIDLTADDDEDVVHLDTRARPAGINGDRPAMAGSGNGIRDASPPNAGFGLGRLFNRLRDYGNLNEIWFAQFGAQAAVNAADHNARHRDAVNGHQRDLQRRREVRDRARAAATARRAGLGLPGMMDYGMVGFDLGFDAAPPRQATPPYEAPKPAEKGFTRSPGEDEEVVCPNCGDELCFGEGEVKQQVFVVKGCGHAYCGDCAHNRTKTSGKKGKGKAKVTDPSLPRPFSKCVVEGCETKAGKGQMVHVYVNS